MTFASFLTGAQIPPSTCSIFPRPFGVIFTPSSILRCNANPAVNRSRWQVTFAARSLGDETKTTHQEKDAGTQITELTEKIRWMLQHMEDGEISISPYDTAWVALVEDIGGGGGPQFPTSLEWIANNQLEDGSWGDRRFLIYDRLLNTLACVVALTAWKLHPHKCNQGLRFLKENIVKVEDEAEELMPVGFEVAFPSLIETAKKLGIEIPYNDCAGMKNIYAMRELNLKKIPMDLVHKQPTSLLFSLEGMEGLVWEKLLKFTMDGSFLSSPSSTAYALHHTKDQQCLRYLLNPVQKFNGGGIRDKYRERETSRESSEASLRTSIHGADAVASTTTTVLPGRGSFSGLLPTILQSDMVSALEGQSISFGFGQRHESRGGKSRQIIERRERDGRHEGKWGAKTLVNCRSA